MRNINILDDNFLQKYKEQVDAFPTEIGRMVYKRTYARPIPEEGRREEWWETVKRVVEFSSTLEVQALERAGVEVDDEIMRRLKREAEEMYDLIFNLSLFPSGRTLWVGGEEPSYRFPLSNFNCSFITIDSYKKLAELFFVSMLGTGVGLSVEEKYIKHLAPLRTDLKIIHKEVEERRPEDRLEYTELIENDKESLEIRVGDSKFGWAKSIETFFEILSLVQYNEVKTLTFNYDSVRPAGERLKTFGGFASGHESLKRMFEKIDQLLKGKPGRYYKLEGIDVLDIATIIAENVVSGGVRRSSLIVFTDKKDKDVIEAKNNLYIQEGDEWRPNIPILHRAYSNNTIKYYSKPSREELKRHVNTMRYTGEPGFDNMEEALRRRPDAEGFNPCNEIILRDRGVCNLTEVNMANFAKDGKVDYEGLYKAQKYSALLGYRMASIELELYEWDMVNREDRLVGCSLTGITDFKQKAGLTYKQMRPILRKLREIVHDTVEQKSREFKMNKPVLSTTIKPSGTISLLPTVASGLHYNHSKYYIRRVRVSAEDPIAKALAYDGFKWDPEVGETRENHETKVFSFPVKAPGEVFKADVGAIEQLEWYKLIMEEYVDHNASITVHVRENEWGDVEEWLYNNWDSVLGISFLPYDGGVYDLAPFEEITEVEYEKLKAETPRVSSETINKFEQFDTEFDVLDTACETGFCPVR